MSNLKLLLPVSDTTYSGHIKNTTHRIYHSMYSLSSRTIQQPIIIYELRAHTTRRTNACVIHTNSNNLVKGENYFYITIESTRQRDAPRHFNSSLCPLASLRKRAEPQPCTKYRSPRAYITRFRTGGKCRPHQPGVLIAERGGVAGNT